MRKKWNILIKDIWVNQNHTEGSGLLEYDNKNTEYILLDNLKELLARLHCIHMQEKAGNNHFHNKKVGLLNSFINAYTATSTHQRVLIFNQIHNRFTTENTER